MKTKKQTLLFNIFVSMGIAAIIFIIVGVIIGLYLPWKYPNDKLRIF